MSLVSAIYTGAVIHRRLRPRVHGLRHKCFWLYLNLDEVESLASRIACFSKERFNLFSFYTRDFGDGSQMPLRQQALAHLARAGIDLAGGPICLLFMPRVLGYGFNPLSLWFCHHADGSLKAIIYEVHNTFAQRHSYLIPVAGSGHLLRQNCAKAFYVSPFMDMDQHYHFTVSLPDESMCVAIRTSDKVGAMLNAVMSGKRRALTGRALMGLFFSQPLLSLKVIAAIHAHALVLWIKGIGLRTRPDAPPIAMQIVVPQTIVRPEGVTELR